MSSLQDESLIDPKQFFFKIINNWPWIILSLLLMVTLGVLYNRYASPVYKAQAAILIKDEKKGGAGLLDNPLLKDLQITGGGKLVDNEIEVLQSYDLIEAAVRREQLFLNIKSKGKLTSRSIFGEEFPLTIRVANPDTIAEPFSWLVTYKPNENKWEILYHASQPALPVTLGKWYNVNGIIVEFLNNNLYKRSPKTIDSVDVNPKYSFNFKSIDATVTSYLSSLTVQAVSKTSSIINLELVDYNQRKAKAALNALIDIYNTQGLDDKKEVSKNTLDFLDSRLAIIEKELRLVEGQVEKFKSTNKITDVSAEAQQYLDQAKEVDFQKADQQTKLNVLESIEENVKANQDGKLVPSASGILDPSFAELVQGLNKLVLEKERQEQRLGAKNPITVDLGNQIENAKTSLLGNIANLKQSYKIALNNINSKDAQLSLRIKNIPQIEKNLVQIKRDQSVKEQLYFFLLQKKEESAITLASTTLDSRSIERPRNSGIVKPNKQLILAISILLGLLLPAAIIYFAGLFDNKIGDKSEVEQKTIVPILGEVSYTKKGKSPIIVEKGSRSIVAEQFRVIRTNLGFIKYNDEAPRVILVTSHRPSEGKSFTSLNLAASFALLNKKVVVLEFDLRRPSLSQSLKLFPEKGISNYLSDNSVDVKDLLIEIPDFNKSFYLLPAGPIPPNPAELIVGERINSMMKELKGKFDYIILDTPPYSLVTDSSLLSKHADVNLVVLRHAYTFKFVLKELNKKVENKSWDRLNIVINRVGEKRNYNKYNTYGYTEYFDAPEREKKGWRQWFKKRNKH
ncbi:MAG: polysaccharide biosynthesis tyrosine autokinase [Agriterribacter sp.]